MISDGDEQELDPSLITHNITHHFTCHPFLIRPHKLLRPDDYDRFRLPVTSKVVAGEYLHSNVGAIDTGIRELRRHRETADGIAKTVRTKDGKVPQIKSIHA